MTIRSIILGRALAVGTGLLIAVGAQAESNQGASGQTTTQGTQDTQQDTHQGNMGQGTTDNSNQAANPQSQDRTTNQGAMGQNQGQDQNANKGAMGQNNTQGQGSDQGTMSQNSNPSDQSNNNQNQGQMAMGKGKHHYTISGKVTSIDQNELTVNDNQQVRLTDQTKYMSQGKSISRDDIKPGEQVRAAYQPRNRIAYATQVWVRGAGSQNDQSQSGTDNNTQNGSQK